ncbi:MAG: filamentous hemagglutinin family protein [Deltaproteobacteria bacterium]|nr:filamentous hemagglutinin family protein [Deltaproteobacteria bacterium]
MKIGAFRNMLLLLGCGVALFPLFCQAGSVNIPGFYGGAAILPSRTVQTVPAPAGSVNIPGFYGGVVTPPPRTALPVLKGIVQGVRPEDVVRDDANNRLVIHQDQPNAVIDWSSFNIGADAWTHFDQQKNPGWVALNRIYDSNPSLIFGRLTADGKVYLINQNGILFGPGSKIDVNSLVASALNIRNSDFMKGLLNFYVDPGLTFDPQAAVSNHGEINAAPGGVVFLIGPRVENAGIINAPVGQAGLAAGTQVELANDPNGERALIVGVKDGYGEAWNREGGQLVSDMGRAGMYGRVVQQEGLIRSVTAVKQNGQIELRATEKIITGSNSMIESPISDSPETADNSFTFSGGKVLMGGLQTIAGDTLQKVVTGAPPAIIELHGAIDAPSGQVTMNAGTRVFLDTGSRINVGGAWSNETAAANVVEAQLNSVELRDAYGQKGGLLKSKTITANALTGSSIGDISGAILSQQKTALEKSIQGGTISVTVNTGDIIARQGATLDFSGGGIRYAGGFLETTKLLSGTKIYDIGSAPLSIQYDKIMGQYKKTYERFGVTQSYSGIYYGGASPLKTVMGSFTRGGDAGSLELTASKPVVLDGQLNGSVTRGLFQTNRTFPGSYAATDDYEKALKLSRAQGIEIPQAGSLTIDLSSTGNDDSAITVRHETSPLPADFSSDSLLTGRQTLISAKTLNEAALGSLKLSANAKITTDSNARVLLAPGGSFSVLSSRIEHSGEISVPAGTIFLKTVDNNRVTGPNTPQNKGVFLASGSRLDVAGERVDNSLAGKIAGASISSGQIQGGTITIYDQTAPGRGVFIQDGATLDVSGGYQIDAKRKITGGNAGTLEIRGSTLMLGGDLRGYAMADSQGKIKGGQIILHASDIDVINSSSAWPADFTADSPVPAGLQGKLVLTGNRFSDTGFTRIELDSFNNITVEPFAEVVPSLVKLQTPVPGVMQGVNMPLRVQAAGVEVVSGRDDLIRLDGQMAYQTGPSAFTAVAGKLFPWQSSSVISSNDSAALTVSSGAAVRMAPEGKIILSATGAVTMAGTLESPAGQIGITAGTAGKFDLVIKDSGRILAAGYNRPDMTSAAPGFGYNYSPRDGGQVTLQASIGDLTLEKESLIDVSGSGVVENKVLSGGKVTAYGEAGNPGSLSLFYFGNLNRDGSVNALAKMAGIKGGTLTVNRTDTSNAMVVKAEDVTRYLAAGFDDLTLKSGNSLKFSGAADVTVGRKLTLDAPGISGSGPDKTILRSPWISLANTTDLPAGGQVTPGAGQFILSSTGWIDLDGKINMSGFTEVRLEASRDIRLMDRFYAKPANDWEGQLTTAGDLTLKADRIYPAVLSKYNLRSTGGKVTILPADNPVGGLIFSAGGNLTVEAQNGIEVRGTLAAPMGTITLKGTGPGSRVYLAEDSVVTAAGNAMVNYGEIDDNGAWVVQDKVSGLNNPMDAVPGKSVTIDAPEIIIRSGAAIDVSGGGSLFAYQFQPGIEGSVNPLTKTRRYVIMSDRSVQLPGDAVYLTGGAGLNAGIYSLLPVQYAFLPGAVVIEKQNLNVTAGQNVATKDGYPVVAGYSTVLGTGIQSARPKAYAVMAASDVLSEGNFIIKSRTAGDAGDVTIKGNTTIIDGRISAAAISGYLGGKISLSAGDILVQQMVSPLPAGFDFKTGLDSSPELQGKLSVAANSLYGKGFQEIDLGDPTVTDNVTIRGGSVLAAPVISLAANKKITVESGAQLQALAESGIGEINLNSPGGTAVIQPGALLHASHAVNLNVGNPDIQGDLQLDHSALTLKGVEIFFVPAGYTRTGPGLYITDSLWRQFSAFEEIELVSGSDLLFADNFNLSAIGSISIDAARIAGVKAGGAVISLTAPAIRLFNSGAASTAPVMTNAGQITFSGDNITVGGGDVLFDGFAAIHLNSRNDLTLKGAGSLKTGGADLNLTAARVTATFDRNQTKPYIASNFHVDAGSNAISFFNSGGNPGTSSVPGGMLEFSARKIDLSGVVEMSAGTVRMTATGSGQDDGIFLHSGGRILARGNDLAPGGRVALRTDNGGLAVEPGSFVDVSAGAQGDAGVVTLQAPVGGVSTGGNLLGGAQGGVGGSLILDTKQLSEAAMTGLIGALATGGFTESLDIRARTGDIGIVAGQALKARRVKLSADDQSYGKINVSGNIDAGGSAGGSVELYAMNDLNINSGARVGAAASTAGFAGGTVLLSSAKGWVNVNAGGTVDVAGKTTEDAGGTVHLRAERNGNDVKINLNGAIAGAVAVYAEAVKAYSYTTPTLSANTQYTTWLNEAASYYDANTQYTTWLGEGPSHYGANTAVNRLKGAAPAGTSTFHLLPGIEVVNSGDINMDVASGWDLTNTRYGSANEPGVLTLRAGGNLNINKNLADHPTPMNSLPGSAGMNSWAINLTAGADTAGAEYLAVVRGQGNLTIKDQSLVYTENAPIRFASGNDTLIGTGVKPYYMINESISYNLASYGGSVRGNAGRDLSINGGAVQTATGNIDIAVGRDLILNTNATTLGSIRTTGQNPSGLNSYWKYAGGGDITIDVGRHVGSKTAEGRYVTALSSSRAWDRPYGTRQPYKWAASYTQSASYNPAAGLVTMGGGGLAVRTGGDFLSQAGTFGHGDLVIHTGGDIRGRFLNKQGRAELHAMGNFGAVGEEQVIEAFDSRINVSARGNIELGAVANPTIASDMFAGQFWNFGYTENTSVSLKAGGDVTITGNSKFYQLNQYVAQNIRILPATVDIEAGGDIRLKNDFALAPSPKGNLRLIAGGDIEGSVYDSKIYVSDMAPADVYKYIYTGNGNYADNLFNQNAHAKDLLHRADGRAVEVRAGRDIKNLNLFLPKKAEITAGRDIRDLYYFGQNVNADDLSKIRAGGKVTFSYKANSTYSGLIQAGPGLLLLQAGDSIGLGNSNGIQSLGNQYNLPLGTQGSSVIILSGYGKEMNLTEAGVFFDKLRAETKSGDSYTQSSLKARTDIIPMLGPPSGSGDINMTVSQVSTNYGKSDIFIIANGALNVGKSVFFSKKDVKDTGILTSEGGAINIFANGDVNVNESRVMTFFGGDITVWSDHGDINAGRGSKTAIKSGEKKKKQIGRVGDKDIYADTFNPPAVGSGIRAVTYDPDGAAGPLQAPPPGDIYPHAKVIDAGEAGLSGGNIFLQAQQVLNAANISSTLGSVVGMPQATAGTANIGNMSGAGTVTAGTAQLSQETAGISSSNAGRGSQMIEDIMAKWLDVKVIDFVQDE